jgi:hypothetical protein
MKKLVSLLAKMSQGDRNLIYFWQGGCSRSKAVWKAARKLASSASA